MWMEGINGRDASDPSGLIGWVIERVRYLLDYELPLRAGKIPTLGSLLVHSADTDSIASPP